MDRFTVLVACLTLFGAATIVFAEGKQPMTVENLFDFKRVADPQVSPDGKLVVYVVTSVDLAANKTASAIWLASTEKGEPRQLTNVPGKKDRHPRWSARTAKRSCSSRTAPATTQLWVIDLSGGEAKQLTTISTEAGKRHLVARRQADRLRLGRLPGILREAVQGERRRSTRSARRRSRRTRSRPRCSPGSSTATGTAYVEDKRQHLFVMSADGGEPKDVTPGDRDAYPTSDDVRHRRRFHLQPGRQVPDLHRRAREATRRGARTTTSAACR